MNIFENLKTDHITINFLDEDGNNTLILTKDKQSIYLYTDYNNVDSMIPMMIEIKENEILFETMLSGDREVKVKVKYEDDMKLHLYKKTNGKIIVDGFIFKDETSSKRRGIFAFSGDFVE